MSDREDTKAEEPGEKKYPFWPDSLQEKAAIQSHSPVAAGLRKALAALGKIVAQIFIFFFLFSPFWLLLAFEWGTDQQELAWLEFLRLLFTTASVFLTVKLLDDIDIVDLGLKISPRAWHDFLIGVAISFLLIGLQFVLLWSAGRITINGTAWQHLPAYIVLLNLLGTLLIFSLVGWSEELLSRGFHLRTLSIGFNKIVGAVSSSVIFACLHFLNPGWSWDYFIFVFLFGLLLCYTYFRTGLLWLPIGLHAGWDFVGSVIFGSGAINGFSIFHALDVGYTPLTSSTSLLLTNGVVLILMAITIHLTYRHKKPEPIGW